MVKRSRKRSAAGEVLKTSEGPSKVVLSASEASVLAPDREIKVKKTVRLTRARAESIRRAIAMKEPVAVKIPVAVKTPVSMRASDAVKREKPGRSKDVIGKLSFVTGKLAGKTGLLFGKVKSLVKVN